jgi:hypothetical protein
LEIAPTKCDEIFTLETREAKAIDHKFDSPAGRTAGASVECGEASSKSATRWTQSKT